VTARTAEGEPKSTEKETSVSEPTLQDLLEAGVHFGHQTRRWNPKMKRFIFMDRNRIYIIDLKKTLEGLRRAKEEVARVVEGGKSVLFVGTKKQAKDCIRDVASRCDQFHITERWLGGTLTNFRTVKMSLDRLKDIESMETDGRFEDLTKKERIRLEKEKEKLTKVLGGIVGMSELPGLLYVVDTKKEEIAVEEARKLGIPIVAIVDTNCDPDPITFPIPGNDDAIRSIELVTQSLADSILEGLSRRQEKARAEEESDEGEPVTSEKASTETPGSEETPSGPARPAGRKKAEAGAEGGGRSAGGPAAGSPKPSPSEGGRQAAGSEPGGSSVPRPSSRS
jgi:small subunit ribosomal protein S2